MDYYIVRIYRRESLPLAGTDLRETSMTGLVENSDGSTEPFHDAATLWQLLAQGVSASARRAKDDMG